MTGRAEGPSNLGIITDEISQDLGEALAFISSYNLRWCELREVWGKNVVTFSEKELERAKDLLVQHGVRVSALASPVFKWDLPELPAKTGGQRRDFENAFTEEDASMLLERIFRFAHFFGTPHVRIFSYWRVETPETVFSIIRDRLSNAAELAAQNGIVLLLENEHACNIGTGAELGRMLREVNSPSLRGIWDPGNALMLGEVPYPDGYHEIAGMCPHVHIKDARRTSLTGRFEWVPVGEGSIDFKGQFKALRQGQFSGTMSLETHYRRPDGNKVESTRASLDGLLKLLAE
jgi:sugar phosphate isomerase/epimerase